MAWPRCQVLFENAMLRAFRTTAIDGEPGELWMLREAFADDPTFVQMIGHYAQFLELHDWQSLPSLVERHDHELVVVAPPWISLAPHRHPRDAGLRPPGRDPRA